MCASKEKREGLCSLTHELMRMNNDQYFDLCCCHLKGTCRTQGTQPLTSNLKCLDPISQRAHTLFLCVCVEQRTERFGVCSTSHILTLLAVEETSAAPIQRDDYEEGERMQTEGNGRSVGVISSE